MKNKAEMIVEILEHKWTCMEIHIDAIDKFLRYQEIIDGYSEKDILNLMSESLSIIFGELNNKIGILNKYEPKHHTDSDYVDMVIESISEPMLREDDKEERFRYIERFRVDLWGHVNHYASKYIKLYMEQTRPPEETELMEPGDLISELKECMTIVMVECYLRIMERSLNGKNKTLREIMPTCLADTGYEKTRAYKMKDVFVVKEHCSLTEQEEYQFWPGTHKNVYFWVELENGNAVGWNENPARGWSFPVIKMKE